MVLAPDLKKIKAKFFPALLAQTGWQSRVLAVADCMQSVSKDNSLKKIVAINELWAVKNEFVSTLEMTRIAPVLKVFFSRH